MIIGTPRIEVGEKARLVYRIHSERALPDELWFAVDPTHAAMLSERADAALVGLLPSALHAEEDVHVVGPVTDVLLAAAAGEMQGLLLRSQPQWSQVQVTADTVLPADSPASGVGLAFSGGIDSFASLAAYFVDPPCPALTTTHLLFTNAGSHEPAGRPLFHDRLQRLAPLAERLDLPLVAIDSNLSDFYWPGSWEGTHLTRNVSACLALQGGLGRVLHSATYSWSELALEVETYQSCMEPILVAMLSTDMCTVTNVLGGLRRMDKVRIVAELPLAYEFLDVCTATEGGGNCSNCQKCHMTMLQLEFAGALERFDAVFDLAAFRRGRDDALLAMWLGSEYRYGELRSNARAAGLTPPRRSLGGRATDWLSSLPGIRRGA